LSFPTLFQSPKQKERKSERKKERKKERKAASCLSSSFLQFLVVEIASLVHQPQKNVKKMGRIMMK